jgi:hypothetical protein
MVARELARAGVELAVNEVVERGTNWDSEVWKAVEEGADPPEDEELFKDNDSLDGGVFTVTYAYYDGDQNRMITNHGVLCESQKASINGGLNSTDLAQALVDRAGLSGTVAQRLVEAIFACRGRDVSGEGRGVSSEKGGLTGGSVSDYSAGLVGEYRCYGGKFRVLHELLLLREFQDDPALFERLAPHLTVHEEKSFSGTSTGTALVSRGLKRNTEQTVLAESRIDFVVNKNGEIEYWHEH